MYTKFNGYEGYKSKFKLIADIVYFGNEYNFLKSNCDTVLRLADFLEGYVDCLYDYCNLSELDYESICDFTIMVRREVTELM